MALLLAGAVGLACASMQRVPIRVEPADAQLFLDGEVVSVLPSELELRSDKDHKLFFKRPGYRPELVVLESVRGSDRDRLEPAEVQVRLQSERTTGHEIRVETEDSGAAKLE